MMVEDAVDVIDLPWTDERWELYDSLDPDDSLYKIAESILKLDLV